MSFFFCVGGLGPIFCIGGEKAEQQASKQASQQVGHRCKNKKQRYFFCMGGPMRIFWMDGEWSDTLGHPPPAWRTPSGPSGPLRGPWFLFSLPYLFDGLITDSIQTCLMISKPSPGRMYERYSSSKCIAACILNANLCKYCYQKCTAASILNISLFQ